MQACLDALRDCQHATDDVPVAARIVHPIHGVLAEATNSTIHTSDPTAHAEMTVIRLASKRVGNHRLLDCTLYVTLEPCMMCFAACMHARIARIVFAASDRKMGMLSQGLYRQSHGQGNHHFTWTGGVLGQQASEMLVQFFKTHCR